MIKFLDLQKVTQRHGAEIRKAIQRVVESGWYLQGSENKRFENNYAAYIGSQYCVGCGNGLDALIWIYRAYIELGVMHPGDEVIVPANTFIASILALTENQLVPVLVEPRFDTLELDEDTIEKHITSRTRSVLLVHLYGRCAYTEKISQICQKHGLKLVEDNAQAHGCRCSDGRRTGSLGDAAGHSFYPGKNLGALGDGGAVTSNDKELIDTVRTLANYGSQRKYVFKYTDRDLLQDYLVEHGVQTLIHYPIPPHQQECYSQWHQLSLPVTEQIHRQELSLPISPVMTEDEARQVVSVVNSFSINGE